MATANNQETKLFVVITRPQSGGQKAKTAKLPVYSKPGDGHEGIDALLDLYRRLQLADFLIIEGKPELVGQETLDASDVLFDNLRCTQAQLVDHDWVATTATGNGGMQALSHLIQQHWFYQMTKNSHEYRLRAHATHFKPELLNKALADAKSGSDKQCAALDLAAYISLHTALGNEDTMFLPKN